MEKGVVETRVVVVVFTSQLTQLADCGTGWLVCVLCVCIFDKRHSIV